MTDKEVVDHFLQFQIDYASNPNQSPTWFYFMFGEDNVPREQFLRALGLLRRHWEQSLAYSDLLLRVARLEAKE